MWKDSNKHLAFKDKMYFGGQRFCRRYLKVVRLQPDFNLGFYYTCLTRFIKQDQPVYSTFVYELINIVYIDTF